MSVMARTEWTPAQLFALAVRDGLDKGDGLADAVWAVNLNGEHPGLPRELVVALWWRLQDGSLANALSALPDLFESEQVDAVARFEENGESRAAVVSLLA